MTALTSTSGGRAPGEPGTDSGDEAGSLHGVATVARQETSLYQAKPFTMRTSYLPSPASEKQLGD